jgi:uncharacterized membrane protein YeaQ/YmgE (transglycosylase-associated protein family)
MYLSGESLFTMVLGGIFSGWLAGKIVDGTGFGLIGDLVIGVIGAFIGSWLLPRIGLHLVAGTVGAIVNATLGAIVLLVVMRLIRGGGRWSQGSFFGFRRRW